MPSAPAPSKFDIVYLVHNRKEFTLESLLHLRQNTAWEKVCQVYLYVDVDQRGHDDGAQEVAAAFGLMRLGPTINVEIGTFGGPVNIMNHHLPRATADFVKLDNDVIVPPGWFEAGAAVMDTYPALSFLGLEPPLSRTNAPWSPPGWKPFIPEHVEDCTAGGWPVRRHTYAECEAIGGVGFMRRAAFLGRQRMIQHSTYGGFTDWQCHERSLLKGWLVPPINLFLLDRLTIEPWASLSKKYLAAGWQRPWTNYPDTAASLWAWWLR